MREESRIYVLVDKRSDEMGFTRDASERKEWAAVRLCIDVRSGIVSSTYVDGGHGADA
jgi:hypothetical protein